MRGIALLLVALFALFTIINAFGSNVDSEHMNRSVRREVVVAEAVYV